MLCLSERDRNTENSFLLQVLIYGLFISPFADDSRIGTMCLSGLFRPLIQKLRRTDDAGEATHKGSEASKEQLPSDEFGELVLHDGCDGGSGVDIVFVHGLRGSRIATWLQDDVCWPRDLIKDDVKNGRIITWGYDARIASVFQYASKESIFGHANALLEDLARIREDKVIWPISIPGRAILPPPLKLLFPRKAYQSHLGTAYRLCLPQSRRASGEGSAHQGRQLSFSRETLTSGRDIYRY